MGTQVTRNPELLYTLSKISGPRVEERIHRLAEFADGGKIGQGGTRLGLSTQEPAARRYLISLMEDAQLSYFEHPMGLVGRHEGSSRRGIDPVVFGSHVDGVPQSGEYDGPAGVIAAIEVMRAFAETGYRTRRPISAVAFTLEESSRFNSALLGSRAMVFGLDDRYLSLRDSDGISVAQAIERMGFDPNICRRPYFTNVHAFVEMHIEQARILADRGIDIGAVTAIATTDRGRIQIGEKIPESVELGPETQVLKLVVNGQAGHSGGTPMGTLYRADGLIPTAEFLTEAPSLNAQFSEKGVTLHVRSVAVEGQALNKIPGTTETLLYLTGANAQSVSEAVTATKNALEEINTKYSNPDHPRFNGLALEVQSLDPVFAASGRFLEPTSMLRNYRAAGLAVLGVAEAASRYSHKSIVGTVGTFNLSPEGQIELGLDLRGVALAPRRLALAEINSRLTSIQALEHTPILFESFPSLSEPTIMNRNIVNLIVKSATALGLRSIKMPSGPGHDAQNFVAKGIRTGVIFVPSKDGHSHRPDEYTAPELLEAGARVLGATVAQLAA